MSKHNELRGQRAELLKQADAIVSAAQNENRNLSTDEVTKFNKIDAAANELRDQFTAMERNIELQKEAAAKSVSKEPKKLDRSASFEKYLRKGFGALNAEERNILSRGTATQVVGTDALGGYGVPQGFSGEVDIALAFTGELERLARAFNTESGNLVPYPTNNDTATDAILTAEAAESTVQDLTLGVVNLNAYKYTSLVKVSEELMQDAGFDLTGFVIEQLGERIARATNSAFTVGTGSSQPSGIVTGSSLGKTAASATAIASGEILDLIYSVNKAYRNSASFGLMMNDSTVAAVRALGLSVTNDFPVFVPSMAIGEPDRIMGIPVYVNNDVAAIATGAKSIICGDMSKFIVRSAGNVIVERIDEQYKSAGITAFRAKVRKDSHVLDATAIKHLIQA